MSNPPSLSLEQIGDRLWELRRWSALLLGLGLVVGIVTSLLLPVRYRATATFTPSPSGGDRIRLDGALASLGSQFGIDLGTSRSPLRFYPRLITSNWFLENLAVTRLRGDTSIFLLFTAHPPDTSAPDYPRLLEEVVTKLRKVVAVELDDRANIFNLSIELSSRTMADAAIEKAISLVTEFDTQVLRSQASESRRFIEARFDSARIALEAYEDSVTIFLVHNRTYEQSPLLQLQYQRLQRRVGLKQEVYTSLARNFEEERIQEVREAPVLTIVDPPHVGWRKSYPLRRIVVAQFVALSAALILGWALLTARRKEAPNA